MDFTGWRTFEGTGNLFLLGSISKHHSQHGAFTGWCLGLLFNCVHVYLCVNEISSNQNLAHILIMVIWKYNKRKAWVHVKNSERRWQLTFQLGFIEIFVSRFQTPTIQPSLNFKIYATENQVSAIILFLLDWRHLLTKSWCFCSLITFIWGRKDDTE